MNEEKSSIVGWVVAGIIGIFLLIFAGCWGIPQYNVWQKGLAGEAEFRRAEQNRKIKVLEAQAKKDAATLLAEAEVERAKGLAQANLIVANSLKGHEEYLRYLWIEKVAGGAEGTNMKEVIYVPTEAGIPILEAGKR